MLVAMIGVLPVHGAAADNAVQIGVVGATDGVLTIPTVETEIDWPILLRRNDEQAGAKTIVIESSLLVGPGGKLQPLRIRNNDGKDFAGKLTLDPLGQAQLQLGAQLPDQGEYVAVLRLITDKDKTEKDKIGKNIQLVTVKINRSVREVTVVGATTAAGLSFTTPDPALEWLTSVRRNDNAAGTRSIEIEKPILVGPTGVSQEVELRKDSAKFDGKAILGPLKEVQFSLVSKLLELGEYNGEIGILVDGKRQAVPLKITRTLKDNPVHIEDVSQVRATIGDTLPVRIRLQETEGKAFRVYRPEIVRLDQKDGNALVQAKYDSVKVYVKDGKTDKEVPETITIGANQLLDLKMVISGLTHPGSYSGVIRLTSDTRKLVDKTFDMGLRRSVCVAAAWILLGVLMSSALRGWLNSGRPAVVLQGHAAAVREKLVAFRNSQIDLVDDEKRILDLLAQELDEITSPNGETAGTIETRIDVIRRKIALLPDWINLRRNLDAVKPQKIGAAVRVKYKTIGDLLTRSDVKTQETEDAAKNLRTYRDDLQAAFRTYLQDTINAFRTEIAALPLPLDPELDVYDRQLEAVLNEVANDSFTQASQLLQSARKVYARVVIKAMQDMLQTANNPPGIKEADWTLLVQDLGRQLAQASSDLNEERQILMWTRARVQWLRAVSQGLGVRIAEIQNPNKDDTLIFTKIKTDLNTVETELNAGHVREAQAAYDSAVRSFKTTQAAKTMFGVQMKGPNGAPEELATSGIGGGVPDNVVESGWQNAVAIVLGRAASSKSIACRLIVADLLLFLVLSLLAVLVGLNILYFEKPAWGGATDIAVAVLWGFGLHALAGNAFQGLQGLAKQISGAGA